jgi:hypothetical protein
MQDATVIINVGNSCCIYALIVIETHSFTYMVVNLGTISPCLGVFQPTLVVKQEAV